MRVRGLVLAIAVFISLVAASVSNADLVHRYSFTADARDSVGVADGVLMGEARVSEGQLQLDGIAANMSHVALPIGGTLAKLESCTIEGWATFGAIQNWSRIFDFGNDTLENMFLTPRNGNNHRVRFAATVGGAADEEQTTAALRFPVGAETHFAVVIDAEIGYTALYLNGEIMAITLFTQFAPFAMAAPTTNNYLGRSQYNDPFFLGSINEFRIYNTGLFPDDVRASFDAGPDAGSRPGPAQRARPGGIR